MKKAIILFPLVLFGCSATLMTTYINPDEVSLVIPIEKAKTSRASNEGYTMGDYTLRRTNRITKTWRDGEQHHVRDTIIYHFSKNETHIYNVELISEKVETKTATKSGDTLITGDDAIVSFRLLNIGGGNDNVGGAVEFEFEESYMTYWEAAFPYVVFNDGAMGHIVFEVYTATVGDSSGKMEKWGTVSGFQILVNQEKFGIVAFHRPTALYLTGGGGEVRMEDRMALYVMAAYVSYLHNDNARWKRW